MGITSVIKAIAALSRSELVFLTGSFLAVGAVSGVIGLVVIPGSSAASGEIDPFDALTPDHRTVAEGLREIIESSRALLSINGSASAGRQTLALWRQDIFDRGEINESEVFILEYSEVLRTIEAITIEASDPSSPGREVSFTAAFDATMSDRWKRRDDASRRVIATGVAGMRVTTAPSRGGAVRLRVRLIWEGGISDDTQDAVFTVTLPAAHRTQGAVH